MQTYRKLNILWNPSHLCSKAVYEQFFQREQVFAHTLTIAFNNLRNIHWYPLILGIGRKRLVNRRIDYAKEITSSSIWYLGDDGCVRFRELPFTVINLASKIPVWIITRWTEFLYKTITKHILLLRNYKQTMMLSAVALVRVRAEKVEPSAGSLSCVSLPNFSCNLTKY